MTQPSASQPLERRDLLIAGALVVAVFGLYSQTLGFDFVRYDDPQYVTANPWVRGGIRLDAVAWAFRTARMGSWHPLTWLSHMLDVELFGLDPAGHHASSAVLHALNAALVYIVLRVMTGAVWRSALVAALFGFHPLHVESVAWVSERKDVLSTFLGLLAMGAYVAWVRRPGLGRRLAVVGLFALSLMSKPMLVTLPLILLLLDHWPLRRPLGPGLVLEKLPLFALSLAASVGALLTQRTTSAAVLPLSQRLANALYSVAAYLEKTIWPVDLAMFYPHPYLPESGGVPPGAGRLFAAAALLLALSAGAFVGRRRRYLPVGWLWTLVSLLPVIGLVQVGGQGMADRYTYFPLIGIFIAAAWGGADLLAPLAGRLPWTATAARAVVLAALAALAAGAWRQAGTWRDSLSLYERAMQVSPRNPTIGFNLANVLREEGRNDEAIDEYRRALAIAPSDPDIHVNLANALRDRGDTAEAMQQYREALARDPRHALAHTNLGSLLRAQGRLDEAEAQYRLALSASPGPEAAYNLANLLRERGELAAATELYEQALALDPDDARAHNNLGTTLDRRGDLSGALLHFRRACELDPRNARAFNNAGSALQRLGRRDEAVAAYRRALEVAPRFARAQANLASVLEEEGALGEAIAGYRRALELAPGDDAIRERLARAEAALQARSAASPP